MSVLTDTDDADSKIKVKYQVGSGRHIEEATHIPISILNDTETIEIRERQGQEWTDVPEYLVGKRAFALYVWRNLSGQQDFNWAKALTDEFNKKLNAEFQAHLHNCEAYALKRGLNYDGKECRIAIKKAIQYLITSAKQGYDEAQYELANLYRSDQPYHIYKYTSIVNSKDNAKNGTRQRQSRNTILQYWN